MSNFTFLTEEQYLGSDKLEILEKRGTKAAITDFSILLGAYVSNNIHIENDNSLEGRTGYYWTKSYNGRNDARVVTAAGSGDYNPVNGRNGGARPALPFSSISSIPTNGESGKRARDGILEVEYGYYPQKAVSKDMQERLERAYRSGSISRTRNSYTTDSRKYDAYNKKFLAKQHKEYEYNGKRYVRVEANSYYDGGDFTLSNGEQYRNGDDVWVEVLPVNVTRRTVLQKVRGCAHKALPQLVNTGFQVLFHSPPGVLFTFPSQYYALSVTEEYLALEGGPSCFPQGFPCLVVLWILPASHQFRLRDFHPL